jgi:hypothetical protein
MPPESIKFNYGRNLPKAVVDGVVAPVRPTIVVWSHLEPLPYNEDLTAGLQAQIADPLWMMARQWQFAEFQGEDAGTPIWSRLDGDVGRLSRYQPGGAKTDTDSVDYQHSQVPLEVLVEQETIRSQHPLLAAQAGEHLLRLLAAGGITTARPVLREAFPLDITDDEIWSPEADAKARVWQRLFARRAIDGFALAKALRDHAAGDDPLNSLPNSLQELENLGAAGVLSAVNDWLSWYGQLVTEPDPAINEAWQPERQEYRFRLSARLGDQEVVVAADEYSDGQLDWYSFDVASDATLGQPAELGDEKDRFKPRTLLPTPVRYPGMPADRYWEFEDAAVNLGYLDAGPTDLARMVLAEYGLVFSNDWFLIPVEMPVGSLFRVKSLQVRDTFGVTSAVGPARNFRGSRWTLFSLSGAEDLPAGLRDLFFLPPTLSYRLEGEPLEEVAFVRDEMANMAWAIERTVQGASGLPLDRQMELSSAGVHQRVDTAEITADLIYRLMTPVADHWLPLVPVSLDAQDPASELSARLELRTLLRTLPDGGQEAAQPRGILVQNDLAPAVEDEFTPPLRLYDEEVRREGATVTRTFQYTRWLDGHSYLWVGRRKRASRPYSASGLRFDISVPTAQVTANG